MRTQSFVPLHDQRVALMELMRAERIRVRAWWAPRKKEVNKLESPTARTLLRAQHKTEFESVVQSGDLITSRDTLIAPAVGVELDDLGWSGPYDPLPALARGGGRRWGSTSVHGDRRHQISVRLPDDVHARLHQACHYEQVDLVNQLESFYETYGDSPRLPDPRPGEEPDQLAARYRDELRAQIITTGDIMRAALDRVIGVVPTTLHVAAEQHQVLRAVLEAERERAREWWRRRKKALKDIADPVQRNRTKRQHERDFEAATESGELVVTAEGLLVPALQAELEARGWDGPYEPLPSESPSAVGQDAGHGPARTDEPGIKLRLRMPGNLHLHLERACYWESVGTGQPVTPLDILHAAGARIIAAARRTALD